MLKIEIEKDSPVTTRSGVSKLTQQPYSLREQEGWVRIGREVRRVSLTLSDSAQPYAAGLYIMADTSFQVSRYGQLELARSLTLVASPK